MDEWNRTTGATLRSDATQALVRRALQYVCFCRFAFTCSALSVCTQLDRVWRAGRGIRWIQRWLFLCCSRCEGSTPHLTVELLSQVYHELAGLGDPEAEIAAKYVHPVCLPRDMPFKHCCGAGCHTSPRVTSPSSLPRASWN